MYPRSSYAQEGRIHRVSAHIQPRELWGRGRVSPTHTFSEEKSVPQTEVVSIAKTQSSKVENRKKRWGQGLGESTEKHLWESCGKTYFEKKKKQASKKKDGWSEPFKNKSKVPRHMNPHLAPFQTRTG